MRTLVVRLGAYGDMIIITPLLRHLKELGHEVYLLTSESGKELLTDNPFIDKSILHKRDSVPQDFLGAYFKEAQKSMECDNLINLCESIEMTLALHPSDPRYNYSKAKRKEMCDKNYYDYTMEFAGFPEVKGKHGELFYPDDEKLDMMNEIQQIRGKDGFVLMWALSGSARSKIYPFSPFIWADLLKKYPKLKIITVGDMACQILETGLNDSRIINKSGKWSMKKSCLATKYVDTVVSPDTGLLHGAGCWNTPKIGLLGHTTVRNITETFENDYSLEANCNCAPCFRLVFNADVQCPIEEATRGTYCMTYGLEPERVFNRICEVIEKCQKK